MANKDCEKVLDMLNEYIDGELDANNAALVRSHIENCPECREALEALKKIEQLLDESTEEAPEALCDRVMERVRAEKTASRKKIVFMRRLGIIAAAAVICLAVIASPMLIMVATGGAKAEADCIDDAQKAPALEDALTGNGAMRDEHYSVIENASADNDNSDIFDVIKDLIDNGKSETEAATEPEPLLVDSGEYKAILLDGSEILLYIDTNEYTAKLGEVEYALKTKYDSNAGGTTYILSSKHELLYFEVESHGSVMFKQIEK